MKNMFLCPTLLFALLVFMSFPPSAFSQVKWEETFDGPQPPAGWRTVNNDGSPSSAETSGTFDYLEQVDFLDEDDAVVDSVGPEAGQRFWFSNFESANSAGLIDDWLISPRITGIENGDVLSFYAGAPDGGFDDSLRVFISTADSSLTSFVERIAYFKVAGSEDDYTKYSFDLSAFAGSDIFVAANYYIVDGGPDGNHSDSIWLDHFSVSGNITSVADQPGQIDQFTLQQNYPNPFNPTTEIAFQLGKRSEVTLRIYNLLGQEVRTLFDKKRLDAGPHLATFVAGSLAAGVYYYKLDAGDFTDLKSMTLVK